MTFGQWTERWERGSAHDLRPTTRELYAGVLRKYLLPRFGRWPLARIGTAEVKDMLSEELEAGKLSASAIRRHVLVLSVVLRAAVDDGRLARNPCEMVKLPPDRPRKMRVLEPHEVAELAAAIGQHYRPLVLTAAYIGLRWGELAGLRVDHVDLVTRRIRVDAQLIELNGVLSFGTTKTKAGVRTVTIPNALADELAVHFEREPVQISRLAFPTPSGLPMRRGNFRKVWTRTLKHVGWVSERDAVTGEVISEHPLAGLVFHELRHTAAALAIAQGAHPLTIKERLGHSSITVTMDRYGKLFPSLDEALARGLDIVYRESLSVGREPELDPLAERSDDRDRA
jgi:integrase